MTTIRYAQDVQPGDVLAGLMGGDRLVTSIRPYVGTLSGLDTSSWRTAHSGDDWAITLIPGQPFRVLVVDQ